MTLSSWSTIALEDVAKAGGPSAPRWFQLYVYRDREVTLDLVRRAERAGYKALAVTVDTPILGRRESDIRNRFMLPSHLTMGNFTKQGGKYSSGTKNVGTSGSGLTSYVSQLIDQTLTWSDIAWLRSKTTLKIVVKGIMTAEDAVLAVKNGVDAVWVSNHGARQLDTTPATIEVLPDIVRAVGGRCEVYVDGGFMRGTDVFKALALGARAVFLGRPVLWGLAHSGEDGVSSMLKLINDELELAMKLAGCVTLADIQRHYVRSAHSFQAKLYDIS
jgi:(S)-2-hydroxy-acid oxidase